MNNLIYYTSAYKFNIPINNIFRRHVMFFLQLFLASLRGKQNKNNYNESLCKTDTLDQ